MEPQDAKEEKLMGYCMTLENGFRFHVSKENQEKALQAIKNLASVQDNLGTGAIHSNNITEKFYAFVSNSYQTAKTFQDAMQAWRWDVYNDYHPISNYDSNKDVIEIEFLGEKLGDDEILFDAIAPFVTSGSYIEMRGEDGERWRWCFENGKMTQQIAKISWD